MHQMTRESWTKYKSKNYLYYSPEEDEKRYQLVKMRWQAIFDHNLKYANGEIYYPIYTSIGIHMTDEEIEEENRKPIIEPFGLELGQNFEKI